MRDKLKVLITEISRKHAGLFGTDKGRMCNDFYRELQQKARHGCFVQYYIS